MATWGLPKRPATKAVSLRFEPLESRCLLSAAPVADPGDLAAKAGDGIVEYHAVICGVADYEGTSNDLMYCDDDAQDFRDALLEGLNWDSSNITLLLNSQFTKQRVHDEIEAMGTAADADDVCVFFFSGHGTQVADSAPSDETDGMDEALCAYSLTEVILDDELSDWMAALPTDKYTAILDTCFAGGFVRSVGSKGIGEGSVGEGDGFAADFDSAGVKDLDDLGYGVVLTACRDNEYSVEDYDMENGVFTEYLLEGMAKSSDANGDGAASVEEAHNYLRDRVSTYVADRYGASQNPMIFDGHPGELRLVQYSGGLVVDGGEELETSEDGTMASFQLSLSVEPNAPVSITLQSTNPAEGTVSPSVLEFTAGNWNTPQEITLTGVDDDLADGDAEYTLRVTVVTDDPAYAGASLPAMSVVNKDNETCRISGVVWNDFNGDGEVGFGESLYAGRTVFLDVDGNGEFDAETDPSDITNSLGEYMFEKLSPGEYTVISKAPDTWETTTPAGGSYAVTLATGDHAADRDFGFASAGVSVFAPADVSETAGVVTGTVSIPQPAEADLIVQLVSDNPSEATVPATVTILLGETSAQFDITVLDDAVVDGDRPVGISATAVGFRSGAALVTVLDNESLDGPVLDPEPADTPGTSNIVSWAEVPGASGYFVECATDAGFSTVVADSGWITATSYEFTGLVPGTTYHYRVKSRTQFEPSFGTWSQTDQADFDADMLDGTVTTADGSVELFEGPKVLAEVDFGEDGLAGWELGSEGIRSITRDDGPTGTERAFEMRGGGEGSFYPYRNRYPLGKAPTAVSYYVRSGSTEMADGYVSLIDGQNGPQAGEAIMWSYCGADGKLYVNHEDYNTFTYEADRWYHVEATFDWTNQTLDYYVDSELVYDNVPFRGESLNQVSYIELNNFDADSVAAWYDIRFAGKGMAYLDEGSVLSTPITPAVIENWGVLNFQTTTNALTGVTVDILDASGQVIAENVAPGTDVGALLGDAETVFLRANLTTQAGSMTPSLDEWSISWQRTEPFVDSEWSNVESSMQSDHTLSISLSEDSVWEGTGGLEAVVSVPHAFPYDVIVNLAAPGEVDIPAQATILMGETEAVVPFGLIDNTALDGGRDAVISVTATDFAGDDDSLQVVDNDVAAIVFDPIASPQTDDVAFDAAMTAYNINGIVVTPFNGTVNLAAAGVTVSPATATFAQGTWSGQITIDGEAIGLTLDAEIGGAVIGTSNPFDVETSGTLIPGDLNGDGAVNSGDLDIVRAFWGESVPPGDLSQGDANGDGEVNSDDLNVIRANWGRTAAAAAVSETTDTASSPARTAASTVSVASPISTVLPASSVLPNSVASRDSAATDTRALARATWAAELEARQNARKDEKTDGRRLAARLADSVFAHEWS